MKFYEIAIGTAFEFEGTEYVKTSQLLATARNGKQRLIRRSAILTSLQDAVTESETSLDRENTLQQFDAFYQTCIQIAGWHPELETARRKFLDNLK